MILFKNLLEITVRNPKDFEEVEVCGLCGGELTNQGWSTEHDWEMWTICEDCGTVEGSTETKYVCPDCNEIKDEPYCDCKK